MSICCFCKCKDTKLKAIHNDVVMRSKLKCVVFANAKILNWKQFTTSDGLVTTWECCFCKCKDTKLKAIHNWFTSLCYSVGVVFANAKILNWKQFTTLCLSYTLLWGCFCKCKDTKLKAIHNGVCVKGFLLIVVFANAKILNWKQFTTERLVRGI